jgi:hypothetical protein
MWNNFNRQNAAPDVELTVMSRDGLQAKTAMRLDVFLDFNLLYSA